MAAQAPVGIEGYQKHMIAAKAQVEIPQPREVVQKYGGGGHQENRESHLRRHQALSEEAPKPGVSTPSGLPQCYAKSRTQPVMSQMPKKFQGDELLFPRMEKAGGTYLFCWTRLCNGAYKALSNYTQLGGVLTVFGLPE